VLAAQRMRAHGARTRHLQYIGKLMRQLEPTALSRIRMALAPGRAVTPRPQPSHRQAPHQQVCTHTLASALPGTAAG
jgi:hypothetical protein